MERLASVFEIVRGYRYQVSDESQLQVALTDVLSDHGFRVEREHRLSATDRIDLLVDKHIGIEVKVAGSIGEVTRQIRRYSKHDQLTAVGLITTRRAHLPVATKEFQVPVDVCLVGSYL